MRFNFPRFHRDLAETLPIEPAVEAVEGSLSWRLGTLRHERGARRRVFLTYASPCKLAQEMIRLAASDHVPPIVFTPYHITLREADNHTLTVTGTIRLAIDELVTVDRLCRLTLHPEFSQLVGKFLGDFERQPERCSTYVVPSGISWGDIRLRFLDRHTVSCRIGESNQTFSYHDFNMVNHRSGAPDVNWFYLMQFAEHNGVLRVDWRSPPTARREQQRKRRLSLALCAFFHIDSEPIVFDRESYTYICRFRIRPESESTSYKPPQQ